MSTLNVSNIAGPSSTGTAAVLSSINGGPISGARNRTINGHMRIDQRNSGATITPAATSYCVDRWALSISQASKLSLGRNALGVDGNQFSQLITTVAAYTPTGSEEFLLVQYIEGANIEDFGWGAAGALPVTLSFWVRSSLTGTFGGAIRNSAANRSYPFSYTISTANTWEKKAITIPGDTTGTWLADNNIGMRLGFSLGTGPSLQGTANTWQASAAAAPTGSVNLVATNGATFYITGVQLEAGTVATPFERRSYGQELALCERYYEEVTSGWTGQTVTGVTYYALGYYRNRKRATPTLTSKVQSGIGGGNFNARVADSQSDKSFTIRASAAVGVNGGGWQDSWVAEIEL